MKLHQLLEFAPDFNGRKGDGNTRRPLQIIADYLRGVPGVKVLVDQSALGLQGFAQFSFNGKTYRIEVDHEAGYSIFSILEITREKKFLRKAKNKFRSISGGYVESDESLIKDAIAELKKIVE